MADVGPPHRIVDLRAVAGAVAALPLLVVVVLGAAAPRPEVTGEGTWTTPLQVLLGVAGCALLAVAALVLHGMGGGAPRTNPPRRTRLLVVFALLLVAIVALPLLDVAPPQPGEAGLFGLEPADGVTEAAPRPVSPTAVAAGLVALVAMAVLALLLARRDGRRRRDGTAARPDVRAGAHPAPDLDGSPTQVVMAAYALARAHVVQAYGAGAHDPPRRLLARAAGRAEAAPLRALTELHLPVRYGRQEASQEQATAALEALARLTARPDDGR